MVSLQMLIDTVLEQIERDVEDGDFTAIEELLRGVPREILESYLPEEVLNDLEMDAIRG